LLRNPNQKTPRISMGEVYTYSSKMTKILKNPFVVLVFRHLATFLCVGLLTLILVPFRQLLEIQTIDLIYLLLVMLSTVFLGLTPGVLTGFLAFLAFNFYFIPPYYTFEVHNTQDLITLIIFLIVSVVMSQLIGQAREGGRLARSREWEATRMYELISTLSGLPDTLSIIQALADHTLETFHFSRVEVAIDDKKGQPSLSACAPEGSTALEASQSQFILKTARGREGVIRCWHKQSALSVEEERLMEAFISQGALSIERIRMANSFNKAQILEESDRLKSSLLNSVSHELRSPLAAIKASVSSLRSGAVDWDLSARQELLATIEEETDHLNLLVGNLLDMSRIESGALNPQKKWNSIGEIAMGVVTKMRKQLQDYHLEIDFPEELPLVPTDYVMIEQVFTNLISNSVKYAPPNSVITILGRKENELIHTQVTNQSPSVPEEHLERIFDKFYRVTAADRVMGTGLGLSICKGIVEAHGGKIWAENQPCCFAFHFTLPLTLNGALPEAPKEAGNG
jgi:two-component system, OmpR family, sensor histidine kinase KdpD